MPFQHMKLTRYFLKTSDTPSKYIYQPSNGDTLGDILVSGYFRGCRFELDTAWFGAPIEISFDGGNTFSVIAVKTDESVIDITPINGLPGTVVIPSIKLLKGNDTEKKGTLKDLYNAMLVA